MYFPLVASDGGISWVGLGGLWSLYLDYPPGSTLLGGSVWYFTLWSLELCFIRGVGGRWVVNPCLGVEFMHPFFCQFPYWFELGFPQLKIWLWPGFLQGLCKICSSINIHIYRTEVGNFHKFWEERYCIWCGLSYSVNVVEDLEYVIIDFWSNVPYIYWVGSISYLLLWFLVNFHLTQQWCYWRTFKMVYAVYLFIWWDFRVESGFMEHVECHFDLG